MSDGHWLYRWTLPADGTYTLHSRALDRAGNREPVGTGVNVVSNQGSPAPATGLSVYDTPADSGGQITVNWQLSGDDGADVSGYEVERALSSIGPFAVVGSVADGISSLIDSTTVDSTEYYYQVVVIDVAGNRKPSSVYGPVISINNDGSDVTPPADVTTLSATPGNEFVHLAWTRSVDSDLDVVDQRLEISSDGGATWGTPVSLGKEAAFYLADGLSNDTSYKFRITVEDSSTNISSGVIVDGTPSSTAYTTVSGTISTDTTWAAGVYYIPSNLTVAAGSTLTISPGVIVKFASGRYINIQGTLNAVGTDTSSIVFTAFTDDSYGGDTNGDGASNGTPGYWGYLNFSTAESASSQLEYITVRYGCSRAAAIANSNIFKL